MVNHHLIEDFTEFKQLKQKRKGYITQELEEVSFNYNYAQNQPTTKRKDAVKIAQCMVTTLYHQVLYGSLAFVMMV
jgi:hypothetical protein